MPPLLSFDEYQALAGCTASRPTQVELSAEAAGELELLIGEITVRATRLDALKKHLWYGKGFISTVGVKPGPSQILSGETLGLLHAAIGLATEAGELLEEVGGVVFDGSTLDKVHASEELGDADWYLSEGATAIGRQRSALAAQNIAKLRVRFPQKFSVEQATNRDLVEERRALEEHQRPCADGLGRAEDDLFPGDDT